MILGCADGVPLVDIAEELGCYPNKIIVWRERYRELGMAGLSDKPRAGRPYNQPRTEVLLKIKELLKEPPPKGRGAWTGALVAERLRMNPHTVWQYLRREGICLHRKRSWCVSTDPEFAKKAADIIGLYLNPPINALVLSVDEKPSMQAIERQQGYVLAQNKKIVRGYKSTYKRHGTLNLFAALEVHTGKVFGQTTERKRREDFLAFMDLTLADYSGDQAVHVILDNYCTHKKIDAWLAAHPNVFFHYTPTSASWLNQIEIWFGILGRNALDGFSAISPQKLAEQVHAFIQLTNKNPHPFKWRKRAVRGSQLRNTIDNLIN